MFHFSPYWIRRYESVANCETGNKASSFPVREWDEAMKLRKSIRIARRFSNRNNFVQFHCYFHCYRSHALSFSLRVILSHSRGISTRTNEYNGTINNDYCGRLYTRLMYAPIEFASHLSLSLSFSLFSLYS